MLREQRARARARRVGAERLESLQRELARAAAGGVEADDEQRGARLVEDGLEVLEVVDLFCFVCFVSCCALNGVDACMRVVLRPLVKEKDASADSRRDRTADTATHTQHTQQHRPTSTTRPGAGAAASRASRSYWRRHEISRCSRRSLWMRARTRDRANGCCSGAGAGAGAGAAVCGWRGSADVAARRGAATGATAVAAVPLPPPSRLTLCCSMLA